MCSEICMIKAKAINQNYIHSHEDEEDQHFSHKRQHELHERHLKSSGTPDLACFDSKRQYSLLMQRR